MHAYLSETHLLSNLCYLPIKILSHPRRSNCSTFLPQLKRVPFPAAFYCGWLWKMVWQGEHTKNLKQSNLEFKETAFKMTSRCAAIISRQFKQQSSDLLISLFPHWIHPSSSSKHMDKDQYYFFFFKNLIFTKINIFFSAPNPVEDQILDLRHHNSGITKSEMHISRKIGNKWIHSSLFSTSLCRECDRLEAINNGNSSAWAFKYLLRCPIKC